MLQLLIVEYHIECRRDLFGNIGMGDFAARAEVTSKDELGTMAESLNAMLDNTLGLIQTREERDAMQTSIQKLLREVSGVADGDLTVEAEVTADMTGAIADSFNLMIGQLRQIERVHRAPVSPRDKRPRGIVDLDIEYRDREPAGLAYYFPSLFPVKCVP